MEVIRLIQQKEQLQYVSNNPAYESIPDGGT